jgi:hypothetical protein
MRILIWIQGRIEWETICSYLDGEPLSILLLPGMEVGGEEQEQQSGQHILVLQQLTLALIQTGFRIRSPWTRTLGSIIQSLNIRVKKKKGLQNTFKRSGFKTLT